MTTTRKKPKIYKQGHKFYKSSDCPVCPQCEAAKTKSGFVTGLGAPARRALENAGITTIKKLAKYSVKEILKLHGIGPSSIPKLKAALAQKNLSFKEIDHDSYTHYHKDGSIWAKGQTIDGVPEGFWQWYRKDGTKLRSGNFIKGKQTGEWTTYDSLGKQYKVTTIKN